MNGADVHTHTDDGRLRNRLELIGPARVPKPMTDRRRAFRFFHEWAGGIVGQSAIGALELARAEALLDEAEAEDVASFGYVWDDEPYDGAEGYDESCRLFESGAWTGPYGAVLRIGADVHESLWGIVFGPEDTSDPYARVVRAELAAEAEDALAEALQTKEDIAALLEAEAVLRRRHMDYAADAIYGAGCTIGAGNRTFDEALESSAHARGFDSGYDAAVHDAAVEGSTARAVLKDRGIITDGR